MNHTCNLFGTLWRTGKWGRAEPRLALRRDLKQELRLLEDRGWVETKYKGHQGTREVSCEETWARPGAFILKTALAEGREWWYQPWGKMPFWVWGILCGTQGLGITQSQEACTLWQGGMIHTVLGVSYATPGAAVCKGFVVMLRRIHFCQVAGNLLIWHYHTLLDIGYS